MKKFVLFFLCLTLSLALFAPGRAEEKEGIYVRITVRDYGDIYAELYPEYAPVTVDNFLKLIGENFYDGLTFHRIISGFMIQGGDPLGNGTGGSSEKIKGEFSSNGVDNPLRHERGVLSMARSSHPDSASSQFFIMHQEAEHLDGSYAAFGKVLTGLDIVDRICQETPVQDNNGTVLKEDQPVMEGIRRVDWAEVAEAIRMEEENGLSGTLYRDPMSPVSFQVPEGWSRTSHSGSRTVFSPEADGEKGLLYLRQNNWDGMPTAYKQQLAAQGITRQDMNTQAFDKETLTGIVGADPELFQEETHSGVLFYAAEIPDDAGTSTCFIGVHDGYIYLFVWDGAREDALFLDVAEILDHLSFE